MAKSWLPLTAAFFALSAIPGCEDNPDQIYSQAPKGAGKVWNDGNSIPYADPWVRNSFGDNFNASSKQELCSGPVKKDVWAKMVKQPLVPPRQIAGLDLAGSDKWTGLDFRDAEGTNCQSKGQGGDESTLTASWGDANEVVVTYKLSTNTIEQFQLNQGYRGELKFASRPDDKSTGGKNRFGQHKYTIRVGQPVLRDDRNYDLNWTKKCTNIDDLTCWDNQATELFDAMMYTFANDLPSTQGSCIKEQTCLAKYYSTGDAVFGSRPLGMYMYVPTIAQQQPTPSTPSYLYGFYVKLMPFSASTMYLKLDKEGPIATAANLGDLKKNCVQKLGMPYGKFLTDCIDINEAAADNEKTKGKLLGGMSHTTEAFNFSLEGVNLDFLDTKLGPFATVGDDDMPHDDAEAHEFNMDIRASGPVRNEYSREANDAKPEDQYFTFGATGAIYREYARRVQADIHKQMRGWSGSVRKPVTRDDGKLAASPCEFREKPNQGQLVGESAWVPDGECLYTKPKGQGCIGNWQEEEGQCVLRRGTVVGRCEPQDCKEGGGGCIEGKLSKVERCTYKGYEIGAPECLMGDADLKNPDWKPAPGCTGFEGFIGPGNRFAAPKANPNAAKTAVGALGQTAAFSFKTALKAGDPIALFCTDPSTHPQGKDAGAGCQDNGDCWSNLCVPNPDTANTDPAKKNICEAVTKTYFKHCDLETGGLRTSLLDGSWQRGIQYIGGDDKLKVPPALQDKKYYFRHWAAALVKYLKAAKNYPDTLDELGPTDCDGFSCDPEPEHLIFDQLSDYSDNNNFEYIDRRFVDKDLEPLKVEYQILINSSNQQEWRFHRKMTRGERALYKAMAVDRNAPPGGPDDNLRISNIVGSTVVASGGWKPAKGYDPDKNNKKDAFYCASTLINGAPDPECEAVSGGNIPPMSDGEFLLDGYGDPILTRYRGALTGTGFMMGSQYLELVETMPFIKSAKVRIPEFPNPYDPPVAEAGKEGQSFATPQWPTVLLDWRPMTPANGIRIPVNAQRDRFIPSFTASMSGSSLDFDLDYELIDDKFMKIQGVQSQNYMGYLFLCQDPTTGDFLAVEPYESVNEIRAWDRSHPGAFDACEIMFRPSAYKADERDSYIGIMARAAGILLNIGLGSGDGRVTKVEMFDPSL